MSSFYPITHTRFPFIFDLIVLIVNVYVYKSVYERVKDANSIFLYPD